MSKMGEISCQARRIVLWLGEHDSDSWLAIAALKNIGKGVGIALGDVGFAWIVKPGSEPRTWEATIKLHKLEFLAGSLSGTFSVAHSLHDYRPFKKFAKHLVPVS